MPCDHWSIGVVAFNLLSGEQPFYGVDYFVILEQMKACNYSFTGETWKGVSDEAKDFISKILVADPSKRMNCQEMMIHPWMSMCLPLSLKCELGKNIK
jgi:serine/threonine protein kinase